MPTSCSCLPILSNHCAMQSRGSWIGTLVGLLGCAAAQAASSVECCTSIAPEFPAATPYGATMSRRDDPRSHYQTYRPPPIDATAPAEELTLWVSVLELQGGPYSAALVPRLRGLGAALFAEEQLPDAISAYGRAIHLLRVNEGLQTFSQTELLEQVIEAQLQVGNYLAADDQHEYLFRIQRANLAAGDPQMLAAVERYADWLRAAYLGELDRDRYPRIVQLMDLYSDTIEGIAEEEGELSLKMLPYLRGKLRTQYLLSNYTGETEVGLQVSLMQNNEVDLPDLTKMRFVQFRDANYRYGQETIVKMLAILGSDPETTPQEIAEVELALADWYQWHRRYAQAIPAYGVAWQIMAGQPDGASWLQDTFDDPLELPPQIVFQPGRLPLRLTNAAQVKARFVVSTHGEAKGIEITSPTSEENQPAVTRGYKYLRDLRFRPRLVEGEVVAAEDVERTYSIIY